MMRFVNLIWDFDGTLFDTYPFMAEVAQQALASFGITESYVQTYSALKLSYDIMLKHCMNNYGLDLAELDKKYNELASQAPLDAVKPFEQIPGLLKKISDSGGRNFVFTHRGKSAVALIEHHGLASYFDEIVSSKITGIQFNRKPEPDGNNYIISKYGLDASKTIAIGDREIDILAAKNAGVSSCLFTENGLNTLCQADFIINDYSGLNNLLFD